MLPDYFYVSKEEERRRKIDKIAAFIIEWGFVVLVIIGFATGTLTWY